MLCMSGPSSTGVIPRKGTYTWSQMFTTKFFLVFLISTLVSLKRVNVGSHTHNCLVSNAVFTPLLIRLFQIERAKVWSPRWVENDKRKGFGGVVENCGIQTLSKNRFFWSVRQGCRSSMRLTLFVSISLWFTADSFVILPPMSGHGLDGRAC